VSLSLPVDLLSLMPHGLPTTPPISRSWEAGSSITTSTKEQSQQVFPNPFIVLGMVFFIL
jgi:hypothetical protein